MHLIKQWHSWKKDGLILPCQDVPCQVLTLCQMSKAVKHVVDQLISQSTDQLNHASVDEPISQSTDSDNWLIGQSTN